MPTYVYETVPADGGQPRRFEVDQRMSDPPLERHPETGEAVRRVIAAVGIISRSGGSDMVPCQSGGCMLPRDLADRPCGGGACEI